MHLYSMIGALTMCEMDVRGYNAPLCGQGSTYQTMDAQADLRLPWAHMPYGSFLMKMLQYYKSSVKLSTAHRSDIKLSGTDTRDNEKKPKTVASNMMISDEPGVTDSSHPPYQILNSKILRNLSTCIISHTDISCN